MAVTVPIFGMDENFISTIVKVPEIHIPELEVTMSNLFRKSDENGKFTSIFRDFDLASETISCWTISAIANFPGVNDLKPSSFFTGLKILLDFSSISMTHMTDIVCVKELVTYSRFLAASKSFPWSNINVVIAIKTISFSIIDELIFTDVSLKII